MYLVNSQFRIEQISAGAQKAFITVQPVLGRELTEVLSALWPEPFASEAIDRFRRALATGEPYHQYALRETRRDIDQEEFYDWQIERVTLPSGEYGVVCYYYDLTAQKRAETALREERSALPGNFRERGRGCCPCRARWQVGRSQ